MKTKRDNIIEILKSRKLSLNQKADHILAIQQEGAKEIIYTHKCHTCNSLYTRETGHKGYGDGLYCGVCGYYSIYPILSGYDEPTK